MTSEANFLYRMKGKLDDKRLRNKVKVPTIIASLQGKNKQNCFFKWPW